jgi:hypothetical protein
VVPPTRELCYLLINKLNVIDYYWSPNYSQPVSFAYVTSPEPSWVVKEDMLYLESHHYINYL